jgi:hypothetical protein
MPVMRPASSPARLHAHGVEGLAFQHALVARSLAGPEREGDLFGCLARMGLRVFGDPYVHRGHTGLPGHTRGHAARVEPIEVAAGRQAVGVAYRVAAVAGPEVAAVERSQQAFDFLVVREHGIELLRALGECEKALHVGGRLAHGAGRLRIRQGEFDPACRPGGGHVLRIDQEGFVDVFAQGFYQRLAEDLQDRHAAAFRIRCLSEGRQAQRLRGLRQFVEVRVQHRDEAREVGADLCRCPFQVAVEMLFDEPRP